MEKTAGFARRLEQLFWAFLFVNPFLDILNGIYINVVMGVNVLDVKFTSTLGVTPSLIVRMAMLVVFALYILLVRDKRSILTAAAIGACWLLSMASEKLSLGTVQVFLDSQYAARFCYNIVLLMVYTRVFAARRGDDGEGLLRRLNDYIAPWFPGNTELNRNRCAILSACLRQASRPRGIYSLTVPTGGGKTVSSLAFGLKHAVENGMKRVIYVIPYTSIIEQNAKVFRDILGDSNVVEHHSGVSYDDDDETSCNNYFQRLASENWDAPVIVTTAVQFFESLYSNRPSQCRKLHNIANSVVIFDEAQMIPTYHLLPCVGAMASLASQFRSTILLCTATQPVLTDLFRRFYPQVQIQELCPQVGDYFQKFQRVTYRDGGFLSEDALAVELQQHNQVLCIVNTRKAAQSLYALLPQEGRFHLSTLMYPAHRRQVLDTVRQRLKEGLPCRVVSTSLIEAGVDVDFPMVWRELAGLDSIAQAAGRCNREGRRNPAESFVTYFQSEHPTPVLQKINIQAAHEALKQGGNPGEPETMERYFTALRSLIGENMDKSNTVKLLQEMLLPFRTVAENFHLIDQETYTVYIPLGDGAEICRPIQEKRGNREDYRRAGQYSVGIYQQHFQNLWRAGDIELLSENSAMLTNLSLYDPETGLSTLADAGKAEFI